jgi:ABC-type glycerol-3-phosphate transport system substrate-binding protein
MAGASARATRRTLGAVTATAVTALGAACLPPGGREGAGAGGAAQAELSQPVTVEWLSRQPYEQTFDLAVGRFKARVPRAEVQRDQQPNNTVFNQKLETLVAAGTAPDIAFAVGSTYHGQAAQGFFEDLTPYTARDRALDVNDIVPFWLEAGRFRGKLYFLPFDPGTTVVFWNRRLFNTDGVRAPDPRAAMTWPQLLEVARSLTHAPPAGQAQFAFEPMADRLWYLLPWQVGAEVFDKEYSRCLLNDSRAIDALQFAADLRGRHGVWRPAGFEGAPTSFTGGTVAMQHNGYWVSGSLRTQMQPKGDDFDVMPLPTFPGRPRLTVGWGSGHSLLAASKRKAIAWELVKHLSDAEVYETLLEQGVMQPVRKSQQNSPAFRKNSPPYSFDVPIEDTRTARTPPFHPAMGELPALITNGLADAFAGKSAVKPLIEQLVPLVDQKLAEYNSRYPAK